MKVQILETTVFAKTRKKLKKNQLKDLNEAIQSIVKNPNIGEKKLGDLSEVWVYKFKMIKQQYLLAYQWDPKKRILLALGVHENFYRDLKKHRSF